MRVWRAERGSTKIYGYWRLTTDILKYNNMSNEIEGKRFAEDFVRIDAVKPNDKILIYDSKDGIVKYAQPSQINAMFDKLVSDSTAAAAAAQSAKQSATSAANSSLAAGTSATNAANAEDAAEGWADDAKEAANAAQGALNLIAEGSCNLDQRVAKLEKLVIDLLSGEMIAEKMTVKNLQVFGETSLIKSGAGAPVIAPDFVGQMYIDTSEKRIYIAVGDTAVANWKQL